MTKNPMKTNHQEDRYTEGIMFVPHTPKGLLAATIQKEEDIFCKLHKIVFPLVQYILQSRITHGTART